MYIDTYLLIQSQYCIIPIHRPSPATCHPPQVVEGGPAAFVHDAPDGPEAWAIGKSSEFHGKSTIWL